MELFKCNVCNLIIEGEHAPDVCPKCGAKKEHIVTLDETTKDKIYKSERTNTLLASLVKLADEIILNAKEGKEINLDPGCYRVFEFANDQAWLIKQFAKAEIETHVKKNKW